MKKHTYYECEKCGKKSEDREEIMRCEAAHYGLSVSEKQEWELLKEACRAAGTRMSITCNEQTNQEFDKAIEKCLEFERAHNLEEKETYV